MFHFVSFFILVAENKSEGLEEISHRFHFVDEHAPYGRPVISYNSHYFDPSVLDLYRIESLGVSVLADCGSPKRLALRQSRPLFIALVAMRLSDYATKKACAAESQARYCVMAVNKIDNHLETLSGDWYSANQVRTFITK